MTNDEKRILFIRGRLAILGLNATTEQCRQFLDLALAQGWKFTGAAPSEAMLAAAKGHTPEVIWKQMWELS